MVMEKINFKNRDKQLYQPGAGDFTLVDVPRMLFLMHSGSGDPNTSPAYQRAVSALYSVAYKLKFMSKANPGIDYSVLPLEGLWWMEDMSQFSQASKDEWLWTMMIRQPDWITPVMFQQACEQVSKKKDPPDLTRLLLEAYTEGTSVQIMHIGPYSTEAPTIARLHNEYLPAHGLTPAGKHHEIYLGDPRKTAPEKLRTVLRQPVRRAI